MKTKVHNLYDYINNLSFSKVIDLYNSLSQSIADDKNGVGSEYNSIYDYTKQEDAEWILSVVGVESFLKNLTTREREERGYYYSVTLDHHYFCNPWEQFMERATEFIEYIENCNPLYYTNVRKAINPSVKVKVAISRTITNVVEIEAVDHADALDYVFKHLEKFDPMNVDENCIKVSDCSLEVLPN